MNLSGIVLAGGKSKRFGFNKVKIKVEKIPLLVDQIFKLSFFCSEVLISTSKKNYSTITNEIRKIENYYKYYCCLGKTKGIPPIRVVVDEDNLGSTDFGSIGPLGGLYVGLKNAMNFYGMVLAFDMPFISYNLLELLVDKKKNSQSRPLDAVVVRTKKGFEVLCGLYSKNCIRIIRENIERKIYKVSNIFSDLDVRIISEDELVRYGIDQLNFFNINTTKDNNNFKRIWNREGLKYDSCNFSNWFCEKWQNFFYRKIGKRT